MRMRGGWMDDAKKDEKTNDISQSVSIHVHRSERKERRNRVTMWAAALSFLSKH
jgi:hypothetical protein